MSAQRTVDIDKLRPLRLCYQGEDITVAEAFEIIRRRCLGFDLGKMDLFMGSRAGFSQDVNRKCRRPGLPIMPSDEIVDEVYAGTGIDLDHLLQYLRRYWFNDPAASEISSRQYFESREWLGNFFAEGEIVAEGLACCFADNTSTGSVPYWDEIVTVRDRRGRLRKRRAKQAKRIKRREKREADRQV